MTVDFAASGYHTCSFEAINDDDPRGSVDLGLAFVALPGEVWPVVGVTSREINGQLRMQYHSGPESKDDVFIACYNSFNPNISTFFLLCQYFIRYMYTFLLFAYSKDVVKYVKVKMWVGLNQIFNILSTYICCDIAFVSFQSCSLI